MLFLNSAPAIAQANNPPVINGAETRTFTVVENARVIGSFTATDADDDDISWSVEGLDSALFSIDASGALSVRDGFGLDYETKTSHVFTVRASDDTDADTVAVTVNVTDVVNEPPGLPSMPTVETVSGSMTMLSVSWNAPVGSGPPITFYQLRVRKSGDDDAEWLPAGGAPGSQTNATLFGLTANTTYEVQVRALNINGEGPWSASGTGTTAVEAPDNVAPVIGGDETRTFTIEENPAPFTAVGTAFTATDTNNDPILWSLEGADAGLFFLAPTGQLQTAFEAEIDYETDKSLEFTVKASDGAKHDTVEVTVSVTDAKEPPGAPEAPTVTPLSPVSATIRWTVPENTGPAIDAYSIRSRVKGLPFWQSFAQALPPDSINNTMITHEITNLSAATEYEVQVQALNADGSGEWSASGTGITPDVSLGNTAPEITGAAMRTIEVPENTIIWSAIGTAFSAMDAQNDTLAWSLEGVDAYSFQIGQNGQLSLGTELDYESVKSYAFTVRVSDGALSDTVAVTLTVTSAPSAAVPEAPLTPSVTASSSKSLSVSWDEPANTVPPITDYDVRYCENLAGCNAASDWTDAGHTGISRTTTVDGLKRNTSYQVQVRATNAQGTSGWSASGTATTLVNQHAPVIGGTATRTFTVAEDAREIANFTATDADGDSIAWSVEGLDSALFSIDADGAVSVRDGFSLDYESQTIHVFTVRASDGTNADTVAVTVNVTDVVKEPPEQPLAPTVETVSGSMTMLSVSWNAPVGSGPPITFYQLQLRVSGTTNWLPAGGTGGTQTSFTLSGLAVDTTYEVQVRAVNADGEGPWSANGTGTTAAEATDNVAPVIAGTETRTFTVAEDAAPFTDVGASFTATDANNNPITWSLEGVDAGLFLISPTGQLSIAEAGLDYETDKSLEFTVKASDGVQHDTVEVTVSVTDAEEPPGAPEVPTVMPVSPVSAEINWTVPENTGPAIDAYSIRSRVKGSRVWQSFVQAPPDSVDDTVTHVITNLSAATEYEVQVQALNAEGPGEWSTTGTGTTPDMGAGNTAPEITDAATRTLTVAENTAIWTEIGDPFSATDTQDDTLAWSLEGVDAYSFQIDQDGQLSLGTVPDYESASSYALTVRVSDGALSDTVALTINVTDVLEPPLTVPAAPTVEGPSRTELTVEWTAVTATGGSPAIDDYDVRYRTGTETWVVQSEWRVGFFGPTATIEGLTLDTAYEVQVRAANAEGDGPWSPSGEGRTAPNKPPVIGGAPTRTFMVAENTASGTEVESFSATDADDDDEQDGNTSTWSLEGADASQFSINAAGQLSTAVVLDYEKGTTRSLTVVASDAHDQDTVTVTVNVTNESEAPSAPDAPTVEGRSRTELTVNWAEPANTGPAISNYAVQYREKDATPPATWRDAGHTGTAITTIIERLTPDTTYEVQVQATNGEGTSSWSASGEGGTPSNAPPVIGGPATRTFTVAENAASGTEVGTAFSATDEENDPITWALGGTDAALFDISAGGQLSTAVVLDREENATRNLTVEASDAHGRGGTVTVTVNVTNEIEAPSAPDAPTVEGSSRTELTVSWNKPANTGPAISDYDVQYREAGTTPPAPWRDAGHTGTARTVTLTGLWPGTLYEAQVQATSDEGTSGWSASGQGRTVPNQAPEIGGDESRTFAVAENTASGSNVGPAFSATDAESDPITWSLEGADASQFAISPGGQLTTAAVFNHEESPVRNVTVVASDAYGRDIVSVTVNVTDVEEPPGTPEAPAVEGKSRAELTVNWVEPANTGPTITDYDVQYREKDATPPVPWRDAGHTGPAITTTLEGLTLDTRYEVQVRATNAEGTSGWSASGEGVTPANVPPVIAGAETRTFEIVENPAVGTEIGSAFNATDADGDSVTWSLEGADAGLFSISQAGQLSTTAVLDYEESATRSLTVVANDAYSRDTVAVTVQVIDVEVPDAPAAVELEPGDGQLAVSWQAPDDGGDPISEYTLQWTEAEDVDWEHVIGTHRLPDTSHTIMELTNGTEYAVRVRATNREGDSDWSEPVMAMPSRGAEDAYRRASRVILPQAARALLDSTASAVSERATASRAEPTPGASDVQSIGSLLDRLGADSFESREFLRDLSFSAKAEGGHAPRDLTVWGTGHYRDLSGDDAGLDWSGDLYGILLGVDSRPNPQWLTGLLVNWSEGSFDWIAQDADNSTQVRGSYDLEMTGVYPYTAWSSRDGTWRLWGVVGYSEGQVDLEEEGSGAGRQTSDVNMTSVALGASRELQRSEDLLPGGWTTLQARGEAMSAWVDLEGNTAEHGLLESMALDVQRLRIMLEVQHEMDLESGGRLVPSAEVGVRNDLGDGERLSALETGLGLTYTNPLTGVELHGHGHILATSDSEEWGLDLRLHYDPGVSRRGLSLDLSSGYGDPGSGVETLWEQDALDLAGETGLEPRLDVELGYRVPAANGLGLLTPYGGYALAGGNSHHYRLGGRWEIGQTFYLNLELGQRESGDQTQNQLVLRVQLKF